MSPAPEPLIEAVDRLREHDPRFHREAYAFVVSALMRALEGQPPERAADPERRHLHGREVVASVVELARAEFGPLAPAVFQEWGVTTSRHIGEIVFQLVACGQLSAQAEDRLEDFLDVSQLLPALSEPGAPARRRPTPD